MNALIVHPLFRHGALVVAAVVALVLLAIFHSVVAGAVELGAHRRAEAEAMAVRLAAARRAPAPGEFAARRVSLVRGSD
jgi:hypothetical protein